MPDEFRGREPNDEVVEWFYQQREQSIVFQREVYDRRLQDAITYLETRISANKDLVEQYNTQQQTALEQAGEERAKSAEVLRNETQRAMDKADTERQRAAQVLRDQLLQQMNAGDESLLQHIQNQREQVALAADAQKEAISKAEVSSEKRFAAMNEYRAQLADQVARFITREVFEQVQSELNRRLEQMQSEYDRRLGAIERSQAAYRTQMIMLGGFITFIITVVVIAVNVILSLLH